MSDDFTGLCQDHSFETAENVCRRCGLEYCELCLVYPFGAKKPLCKECAMVAGGVRSHAARPEMPKRDVKRRMKAWQARADRGRPAAAVEAAAISDRLLNDPLAPTPQDLERIPTMIPDHGTDVVGTQSAGASQPPRPPVAPADGPADGVAPPIDWSQPFG